jgi:hypothetical protein
MTMGPGSSGSPRALVNEERRKADLSSYQLSLAAGATVTHEATLLDI